MVTDVTWKRARGDWRTRFLDALAQRPNVAWACQQADVSRNHAYRVKRADPGFSEAWDACLEAALDNLEEAMFAAGAAGDVKAAQLMLTAHRPIYRQRREIMINDLAQRAAQALGIPYDELERHLIDVINDAEAGRLLGPGPQAVDADATYTETVESDDR